MRACANWHASTIANLPTSASRARRSRQLPGQTPATANAIHSKPEDARASGRFGLGRSALRSPDLQRHHVGQFAIVMRPAVDRPSLTGLVFAHDGGRMWQAADDEPARDRLVDCVMAEQ